MKTIEFKTKIQNGIIKIPSEYMELDNRNVQIALSSSITDEDENVDIVVVNINKELLNILEKSKIQNYLEKQLQFLYVEQIKNSFDKAIIDSQIDNDEILENSRLSAWNNYKDYFLKDIKTY